MSEGSRADAKAKGHIATGSSENPPVPRVEEWSAPFYAACRRGVLALQRCKKCGEIFYYPRILCPECLGNQHDWVELSGRGSVYSYSVVWRPHHPAFLPRIPMVLAAIRLNEGPFIVSNVVNCLPADVHIGLQVQVVFEEITEGITLPKFKPV